MDSEEAEGKEAPGLALCVPAGLSSPSAGAGLPGVGLGQHTPSCPLSVHFHPDLEPAGRGVHTGLSTADSEATSSPQAGRCQAGHTRQAGTMPRCGDGPGALRVAAQHSPWTRSTWPPGSLERLWALIPRPSIFHFSFFEL